MSRLKDIESEDTELEVVNELSENENVSNIEPTEPSESNINESK